MKAQQRTSGRRRPATRTIPTGSLADEAYVRLKRNIIRCELPPDVLVTESRLVRESGLGKTPVREALARLVQEGFVRSIPRHGYVVAPVTLQDVDELFGLRLIVEPAAAELAAGRVDPALLRELDEVCTSTVDPADAEERLDRQLQANRELHLTIARASGNRRLAEVVERLLDESERMLHLSLLFRDRQTGMVHDHHHLIEAVVAGDGQTARRVAIEQLQAYQRTVTEALLASPSILSAHVTAPGPLHLVPPAEPP